MITMNELISNSKIIICYECHDAISVSEAVWMNDYILCHCCGNESDYDLHFLRSCVKEIYNMNRYYQHRKKELSQQLPSPQNKKKEQPQQTQLPELPQLPTSPNPSSHNGSNCF